jgi:hypothetical protein
MEDFTVRHTPGPWTFSVRPNYRDTGSAHYTVENPTFDGPCQCGAKHPPGKLIAWLAGGLGDADIIERHPERARHDASSEADARLIAAAPELLEALKRIVSLSAGYPLLQAEMDIPLALAAIARAEG